MMMMLMVMKLKPKAKIAKILSGRVAESLKIKFRLGPSLVAITDIGDN